MEVVKDCKVLDFGLVEPGKTYSKKIKMKSEHQELSRITEITSCDEMSSLDEEFSVKLDEKKGKAGFNRLFVSYSPSLPHLKSFVYKQVQFDDDSSQFLHIKGATKGSNIKLSISKIYLYTTLAAPTSEYRLLMENTSDCYDLFQWDFVCGSEVDICPKSGVIHENSRIDIFVTFHPKKIGLFYRSFPCLLKFQEPLYIEVLGFHSKTRMKLDLEKYIILQESLPTYPTNFCRYVSDCADRVLPESKPTISASKRFINFGSVILDGHDNFATEYIFLTNHANNDLTAEWESSDPDVFTVHPSKFCISQNGGVGRFSIIFSPKKPELFYCCEIHASFMWGVNLEYKIPFSVTVQAIGDTFTDVGWGWWSSYSIERTKICLPGTVPDLTTYTTFRISRSGQLPLQFQLEPIVRTETPLFLVKPTQGLITEGFQLVVVQMIPASQKNDVIYKEEWYLTINKCGKVKLEICGSRELPFLLVGDNKNIYFPTTTLRSIFYLQVPFKNPTRLELEYHCLKSLRPDTFDLCQENTKIGPGEKHFVEFEFRPKQLGEIQAPMGISVKWSPYHSAALKSLRGVVVQAETVVNLTGRAELEKVYASPKHLSLTDVLLHDWGIGSFFVHNSGNSTAFIRFECITKFRCSAIGPWKMIPNDITLEPYRPIEVMKFKNRNECSRKFQLTTFSKNEWICGCEIKLYVLGIERGFNVFNIQYKLYESSMFRKEASEPKDLLNGDIFVYYPFLKIEDIRYQGLAKSLSKFFLWKLLQINKLNDILRHLETKCEHYSDMKIPEYQENSAALVVEFLLKNNSYHPVWVSVNLKKHCACRPVRKDSISRRLFDYSCPHETEMTAGIRDNILAPGSCTILMLTTQYEVVDSCSFAMILYVATAPDKKWKTTVRIEVERGIIATDKASLCFLQPKEYGCRIFHVALHDIYLGDPSIYHQVIWLYNHSQSDCGYWAEWLTVNNKVFRLINDKAIVPAYSSRPLFIQFTPYELKAYKATLALVNESGIEFHFEITGNGTARKILNTVCMRNKVPILSRFEEDGPGPDLELSMDHVSVRALPTHSYDSYVFFMKNTSKKHVIYFSWERLIVWSTLKVKVVPKQGELLPGEIFPVQMNLHTYRLPAVFNFAVQCLYFRKTESDAYFRKCARVTKFAMVYDSCFVLVPDKNGELTYRNPRMGAVAGKTPKNQIISIGGSIRIFNTEFISDLIPDLRHQMSFMPQQKLNINHWPPRGTTKMDSRKFFRVATTLTNIIRDVVNDPIFQANLQVKRPLLSYMDLPQKYSSQTTMITGRQMGMLMCNLLFSSTMKLFGVDPISFHDVTLGVQGTRDKNNIPSLFNPYYRSMLSTQVDQVCIPESTRPRRLQSRDNLAFVQRTSV